MANQSINLLPTAEAEKHKINPYVAWFFRSGVYLLLSAYTVVLIAFGYRWYQEDQLTKVKASIQESATFIESSQSDMAEFTKLQSRYRSVGDSFSEFKQMYPQLVVVQETIPLPITIDKLSVNSTKMKIDGISNNYVAINQWEADLKKREEVLSVTLTSVERIETDDASGVDFSFDVKLK